MGKYYPEAVPNKSLKDILLTIFNLPSNATSVTNDATIFYHHDSFYFDTIFLTYFIPMASFYTP